MMKVVNTVVMWYSIVWNRNRQDQKTKDDVNYIFLHWTLVYLWICLLQLYHHPYTFVSTGYYHSLQILNSPIQVLWQKIPKQWQQKVHACWIKTCLGLATTINNDEISWDSKKYNQSIVPIVRASSKQYLFVTKLFMNGNTTQIQHTKYFTTTAGHDCFWLMVCGCGVKFG